MVSSSSGKRGKSVADGQSASSSMATSERMSLADIRRSVSVAPNTNDREIKISYLRTVLRYQGNLDELDDNQLNLMVRLLEKSAERRREMERNQYEAEGKLRNVEKELNNLDFKLSSKRDSVAFLKHKIAEEDMRHKNGMEKAKQLTQQTKKQANIEQQRIQEADKHLTALKERNENMRDAVRQNLSARSNNNTGGGAVSNNSRRR